MIITPPKLFQVFHPFLYSAVPVQEASVPWHCPVLAGFSNRSNIVSTRKPFSPDLILRDLREHTPAKLRQLGDIHGLIFDMDDTLLPRDAEQFEQEVLSRLHVLKQSGFKIGIVTNNDHSNYCRRLRAQLDAANLHLPFVENVIKPGTEGLQAMCQHFNLRPDQVATIGDNRFTDTWGGRRLGAKPVLVQWYFHPQKQRAIVFYARQLVKLVCR